MGKSRRIKKIIIKRYFINILFVFIYFILIACADINKIEKLKEIISFYNLDDQKKEAILNILNNKKIKILKYEYEIFRKININKKNICDLGIWNIDEIGKTRDSKYYYFLNKIGREMWRILDYNDIGFQKIYRKEFMISFIEKELFINEEGKNVIRENEIFFKLVDFEGNEIKTYKIFNNQEYVENTYYIKKYFYDLTKTNLIEENKVINKFKIKYIGADGNIKIINIVNNSRGMPKLNPI